MEEDVAEGRTPKEKTVYAGNPDTKFYSPKNNNNDPEKFNYKCAGCKKIFKSPQELQNHTANHEEEFYTCLILLPYYAHVQILPRSSFHSPRQQEI